MTKLFIIVLMGLSAVFIYQSGTNKSLNKLEGSVDHVVDAGKDVANEVSVVTKKTTDALGLPKVQKELKKATK